MLSFSTLEVTVAEREYLDTRWSIIENCLKCSSASELALMLEIAKISMKFQAIDYIAIALGYCQRSDNGFIFDFPVIIDMVDNYNWLDDAFKNTKLLRMLVKSSIQDSICYLGKREAPRKLLAHIIKKFPSIKKMNLMFTKTGNGKLKRKIADEELDKWY